MILPAATSQPNSEDLNGDQTLSETESYFQYKIRLDPQQMVVGQKLYYRYFRNKC